MAANETGGASAQGVGGSTWVPPSYADAGSVPPTVDESGLPQGTCRSGALYYRSGTLITSSSIPVERLDPPESRPEWANTTNLNELSGPMRWNTLCEPYGLGLAENGEVRFPPGDGDVPVLSGAAAPAPSYGCNDYVSCHQGGGVGVTWDCGAVPRGTGGAFTGGVYALIGYVNYGTVTFPRPGAVIQQTLYIGNGRALLASNDDNNFGLVGTYTYVISDNAISLTANCESQPAQYRAFPAQATFTVTESGLELFDSARQVRSTFVRITP